MNTSDSILVFTLDDQRYGLHLSGVERVIGMVEITHLPEASTVVKGIVNLQGKIIPVLNLREMFGLPERDPELNDRLIVARTMNRSVAFHADDVAGIIACSEGSIISSESILPERSSLEGIVVIKDGMVLIYDLDRFLTSAQKSFLAGERYLASNPEPPPEDQERI